MAVYYSYMPAWKTEPQPHYQEAIYDSQVTGLLSQFALKTDPTVARRNLPAQNTVDVIDQKGSDGEDASGFVGFASVQTPDERSLAVVHSWQFYHHSGLPTYDASWFAEFDDVAVAKSFWKSWRPSFRAQYFLDTVTHYAKNNPDKLQTGTVRFHELGLLNAWYDARQDDTVFLDAYATDVNSLVHVPAQHKAAPDYVPGRVYKVPRRERYMTKIAEHTAKTCLAAFIETPARLDVRSSQQPDQTWIQWSDGSLEAYPHRASEPTPQPLSARDIRRTPASTTN